MTEREKALIEALEIVEEVKGDAGGESRSWRFGRIEACQLVASRIERLLDKPTDGWIPWSGGECPVDPETEVMLRLGDGGPEYGPVHAGATVWKTYGCSGDIIAYRIISEPEKAKCEHPNTSGDVNGYRYSWHCTACGAGGVEEITPKPKATAVCSPKTCSEEITPLDRPVTVREMVLAFRQYAGIQDGTFFAEIAANWLERKARGES